MCYISLRGTKNSEFQNICYCAAVWSCSTHNKAETALYKFIHSSDRPY